MKSFSNWLGSAVVLASFSLVAASVGIARWSGAAADSAPRELAATAPLPGPPVRLEMTMKIPQESPHGGSRGGQGLGSAHLFDVEGINGSTMLHSAQDVLLSDKDRVIGVVINGEARAYAMDAFAARAIRQVEDLGVHIVHDAVGDRSICVTHCDRTDASRVLTNRRSESAANPASIRLGGWNRSLLLLIDGQRYDHAATDLPFDDVPFETTTWGKWRAAHPQSRVYAGY